jgi:mannose-6-phosphate isomerase-like protein (cupin superfamily)
MASIDVKSFDSPDETRQFEGKGHVDIIQVGDKAIGKATFEPGWRWSENVKPIAKTDSCQSNHFGYVVSGRMRVMMDDGAEAEAGPGDVMMIEPGHDAEIIGDEPCVVVDWGQFGDYAKR